MKGKKGEKLVFAAGSRDPGTVPGNGSKLVVPGKGLGTRRYGTDPVEGIKVYFKTFFTKRRFPKCTNFWSNIAWRHFSVYTFANLIFMPR